MKNIYYLIKKMLINPINLYCFMLLIIPKSSFTQVIWNDIEVKANKTVFQCNYNSDKSRVTIHNKYNKIKTEGRREYNPDKDDFFRVNIQSHDSLIQAFKEAFSAEKILKLSKANEFIYINIVSNEKGDIIDASFSIIRKTLITPTEIEQFEINLFKNVPFSISGKTNEPISYRWMMKISFKEVEKGEIKKVKKLEKN